MKPIYTILFLATTLISGKSYTKEVKDKPIIEFRSGNNIDQEYVEKNQLKITQFESENIDLKWASEAESEIISLITGYTSEYSLHSVQCKTAMCKITVNTFNDNDVGRLSALMNITLLAFYSERFDNYQSRSIYNKETGELDIYFYPAEEESD